MALPTAAGLQINANLKAMGIRTFPIRFEAKWGLRTQTPVGTVVYLTHPFSADRKSCIHKVAVVTGMA